LSALAKLTWISTRGEGAPSGLRLRLPRTLPGRLWLLAICLALDILLLASTPHSVALLGALAPFGIVSFAVFVGLGYSYLKAQRVELRFGKAFFAGHLACVLTVSATNLAAGHGHVVAVVGLQLFLRILLILGMALLALACVPFRDWIACVRETKLLWLYSALAGAVAWCLRFPFQSMWDASGSAPGRILQFATFHSVGTVLRVFLPEILVDPATFVIRAPHFAIFVAEACSGLEGLGLVLVFTVTWLWYFRRESRLPQALLLVPCALGMAWVLNILRICLLVLIGNAGYGEIAMVGFHSQAGWIAFTLVALGFSMATRRWAWVRRDAAAAGEADLHRDELSEGESPATGAYLIPFLAILAASFVAKAGSGQFEWLYPLRFLAGAGALWFSWAEVRKLEWRVSWVAPLAGAAVFGIWIAPSLLGFGTASALGDSLAGLTPAARFLWIAFRVAAAVLTVPMAEELAFRGYLARRLVDREFDSIPFSAVTVLSIGLSSVAFGLMHGRQWIVGVVAGVVYAAIMKRTGRLSDAIAAHATSNLLLAVWVLSRGDWAQW
jgi:exosortase E/protease (VPEID-CTERM system)